MKHGGKMLAGLIVTIGLLWLVLKDVDFALVVESAAQGDFVLLGASIALTTFGFVVRAMRWAIFLEPVRTGTGLRSRFAAVAVHFMANNILWLRVGEFARAWVFSRLEPVKASAAFGTVVVERFMDAVVLLALLVVPVVLPDFPGVGTFDEGFGAMVFQAAAVGVLAILAALILMAAFPTTFVRIAEAVSPVFPRAIREPLLFALRSFLDSLAVLREPRLLALGLVWSFGFWGLQAASFWLGMMAFGIHTGYMSAVFTSSVVAYAVALPSTPGAFGPFQVAAVFALSTVYGATEPQAVAFAFGWHFAAWIPITLIGLYYVAALGLSLGDVKASENRLEKGEAEPGPDDPSARGPAPEAAPAAPDGAGR